MYKYAEYGKTDINVTIFKIHYYYEKDVTTLLLFKKNVMKEIIYNSVINFHLLNYVNIKNTDIKIFLNKF